MSPGASPLLDMPPELTDLVASFLPSSDLRTLRLVNGELGARSRRHMLKENFSELRIFLALPSSLSRSLNIVQHETLRKSIKTIRIYIAEFHHDALELPPLDDGGEEELSPEAQVERTERCSLYFKLVENQESLKGSGNDERQLGMIFSWLQDCKNVTIFVHDSIYPPDAIPRDLQDITKRCGGDPYMAPRPDDHRPLQIILKAIKESEIQPTAFATVTAAYAIPVWMFSSDKGFCGMRASFQNLTSLWLSIQSTPEEDSVLSVDDDILNFVDYLKTFKDQLRTLSLASTDSLDELDGALPRTLDKVFASLGAAVHFPNIEGMGFHDMVVDYSHLLRIFTAHGDTLRNIFFYNIHVTGCDMSLSKDAFDKKILADFATAKLPSPHDESYVIRWSPR